MYLPCRNCPVGNRTDGAGATTCIKESGSSSEEEKKKDCPEGTKYVAADNYGSGCRPECRPGSYSDTGLYPCQRCAEGDEVLVTLPFLVRGRVRPYGHDLLQ